MNDYRPFALPLLVLGVAVASAALGVPVRAADEITQSRAVPAFDKIRLEGAFTTEIRSGAHVAHVSVSGTPTDVNRVETEVRDGSLVVRLRDGGNWFGGSPRLAIELPTLRGFATSGAGSTHIGGVDSRSLDLADDGAARIVVAGRAERATIALNGAGMIDTTAVDAGDVSVVNDGVGSVRVRASGVLTMTVNGVGEILYAGKPSRVESQVNGIGRTGRI
jgi:hypothetical protein